MCDTGCHGGNVYSIHPWITLAAMAVQTERVRLGAILHPLPWRQPWLFARDSATLDQLSHGRLVVSIVMEADTRGDTLEQARAKVRGWAEAGVTWWVETMWSQACSAEEV